MSFGILRRVAGRLWSTEQQILRYSSVATTASTEHCHELKPWKAIPGPPSLPLIGQLHHFLPKGSLYSLEGQDLANELYEKYGEIIRIDAVLGRPPVLYVFEPKSIAEILRGENWFPRRPTFFALEYYKNEHKKVKDRYGGLLASQGEEWRKFRSIVNPVLLKPKNINLYETEISEISDEMLQRLKSKLDENNMIKDNLVFELNLWALESTALVALGSRINCLDPNIKPDSPAYQLIHSVDEIFTKFEALNSGVSFWRYYPTKLFKRAMKAYETQEKLAKFFIQKAMNDFAKEEEREKGALQKLLEIDENVAFVMAIDMLMAGVDTVANTLVAALYLIAANPEKQDKLREELKMGHKGNKYLKACLKETLRMKPIVSTSMRQIDKDYDVLGYKIPKDTMVLFGHHVLSMSDEQFPRAQEFLPERWIVEKGHPLHHGQADPLVYNPFGFGARSCIGKRLAALEMELMLAKLTTNFKIEWFGPPIRTVPHFLNNMAPPYNFKFLGI